MNIHLGELRAGYLITATRYDHDQGYMAVWVDDRRYYRVDGKLYREDEPIPQATFGVD